MTTLQIVLTLLIAEALIIAFVGVFRWWYCRWGATPDEFLMPLPEDELAPMPSIYMTHAITVNAPVEKVWPWFKQVGQGRGGYYSYDWLERLFGFGIHNVYQIRPELQDLKAGDHVRLHKNGMGVTVERMEENKKLVLWTDSRKLQEGRKYFVPPLPRGMHIAGYWSFNLFARPDGTTRIVERWGIEWPPRSLWLSLILIAFGELPSFIMEQRMLRVIKKLAEGESPENLGRL
jgi:hypothetical protein